MPMRPRTFRRLVLSLVFGAVVCIGLIGYFVVGPMQQRRSIEELRTNGMSAYEAGDYATATQSLRRYLRATKPAPAAELLAYARSRAKVEAGDSGHLQASISAYRDYLNQRPDDQEVSIELLKMFNRDGKWPEAVALGVKLRAQPGIDKRAVLEEELSARKRIDPDDKQIAVLFEELLSLGSPSFATVWSYAQWLDSSERLAEADAFLEERIAIEPNSIGAKVLGELIGDRLPDPRTSNPIEIADKVTILTSIIGWNNEEQAWEEDFPAIDSIDLGKLLARAFDLMGRGDLALEVEGRIALETEDQVVLGSYARRLWWAKRIDRLQAIEVANSDLLGFQVLAAQLQNDADAEAQIRAQLKQIDTDFRANGWTQFFEATDLIEKGDLVAARGVLAKAMSTNPLEPTYHLVMGDLYSRLGRETDAKEEWRDADTLAEHVVWIEPTLRLIASLQRSEHRSEAGAVAQMLMARAPREPRARLVWLSTQAMMARSGLLSDQQIDFAIITARRLAEYLPKVERDRLSANLVVLLLVSGQQEEGIAEIRRLLDDSVEPGVFASIIEIDQFFDLGVVETDAAGSAEVAAKSPDASFGYAHKVFVKTGDLEEAMQVFDTGRGGASPVEYKAWDLTRVKFLDTIGEESAKGEWLRLLNDVYPDDIELQFEAIDSRALGLDIGFVDRTIEKILDLTSSKGRSVPIRLRLARARAIASGDGINKSKREEALSIVRGVIVSDPQNIRARLMLSNILDLPCPPELVGNERFTRDRAGAAAEQLTISRLIAGPEARDSLFRVSQLNIDIGDSDAARENLLEAYARSEGDVGAQYKIILEMRRAGEFELAIPRLADLIGQSSSPLKGDVQITLARILSGLNRRAQVLGVLVQIAESESLTESQLIDLITLFVQIGNRVEGEQVLVNAGAYGLDEQAALNARIQFAIMTGQSGDAEQLLQSIVDADASNIDAWRSLARLMGKDGRSDEAKAMLEQALELNPEDELLKYDLALMSGDGEKINQVVRDSSQFENPNDRIAMQRIVSFEKARQTMSRDEIAQELRLLGESFQDMVAVQNYIYEALREVSADAESIGRGAEAASRRVGTHAGLLETATRAYADAGDWESVRRTTEAWRGVSAGSPIGADVFAARASYELRYFADAKELLWPYFDQAAARTEEPLFRELLLIYAQASIGLGDPMAQLAAQLEPLAIESESFRNVVWLQLAATSLPDVQEASRWIEFAQSIGGSTNTGLVVQAWLGLAERSEADALELFGKAFQVSDDWIAASPNDSGVLSLVGQAYRRAADSRSDSDPQRTPWLTKAMGYFDGAAEIDPENLGHLFSAARCAGALQSYPEAISRYRDVLSAGNPGGLFGAAVRNNLAQMLEQGSESGDTLEEAKSLAEQAVAFQAHPAFLGTLGWIELRMGNGARAEELFRQILAEAPDNREGWGGLAACLYGSDRAGEGDRALERFNRLKPANGHNRSLLEHLARFGVEVTD